MRLFRTKVFSGTIFAGKQTYSLPDFERQLGAASALAIEVIVSDMVGSPTGLTVELQTSNTGNYWKSFTSGFLSLSLPSGPTGGATTSADLGDRVRVLLSLTAGTSANVDVYATGRGQQDWS